MTTSHRSGATGTVDEACAAGLQRAREATSDDRSAAIGNQGARVRPDSELADLEAIPPLRTTSGTDQSIEMYFASWPPSSGIYLTLLLTVALSFAAAALVRIPLSVSAIGTLSPRLPDHDIVAGAGGWISNLRVRESDVVQLGDTLAILRSDDVAFRQELAREAAAKASDAIEDLKWLTSSADIQDGRTPPLRTDQYLQAYEQVQAAAKERIIQLSAATRALADARTLQRGGFIPTNALETAIRDSSLAALATAALWSGARLSWQRELRDMRQSLATALSNLSRLRDESRLYTILAPANGRVVKLGNVTVGGYVQPGMLILTLAPASELMADVLVAPRDISSLTIGAPVHLHIDALSSSQWSFIEGAVAEMPTEVSWISGQPHFRVRCRLTDTSAVMGTRFKSKLLSGMTLQARFPITKRSLLGWLSESASRWKTSM